jgi:hypothetical protein
VRPPLREEKLFFIFGGRIQKGLVILVLQNRKQLLILSNELEKVTLYFKSVQS